MAITTILESTTLTASPQTYTTGVQDIKGVLCSISEGEGDPWRQHGYRDSAAAGQTFDIEYRNRTGANKDQIIITHSITTGYPVRFVIFYGT